MIVYDSGQFFWGWDVSIVGLDVDPEALGKAERGLYHQNSFRAMTAAATERHFVKTPAGVQAKDVLPTHGEPAPRQPAGPRQLRRHPLPPGRDLLPQRPHLFLRRHHPARSATLLRFASSRRLPVPRPCGVALAITTPSPPSASRGPWSTNGRRRPDERESEEDPGPHRRRLAVRAPGRGPDVQRLPGHRNRGSSGGRPAGHRHGPRAPPGRRHARRPDAPWAGLEPSNAS